MSAYDRFDRDFAEALVDLAGPRTPDYFEDVLERAISRRQRPAWTFPERWLPIGGLTRRLPLSPALPARTVGLLLMLLLLLAATVAIGIGAVLWQQRPAPPFGIAANGVVAYGHNGDIYSAQPDGSQSRLIIGGSTTDGFPVYSRDGRSLYFLRLVRESPDVVAVMAANADGSDVRILIPPEEVTGAHWSNVSPTGDVMALANEAVGPHLSIINLVDGTRTALELPVEVGPHEWFPGGDEILLVGHDTAGTGIYAVHPDGSGFRTIVEPHAGIQITLFMVSDDGRFIAYSVRVGTVVAWRLVELATGVDTVHQAPIGQHQGFSAFSPDSSRVAFVRYSDERASTMDAQVFVGPLDDPAAAVAVGPRLRVPSGTAGLVPQFSPDATKLLIASDEGELQTWLVDLRTGEYDELPIASELGVSWQRRAP